MNYIRFNYSIDEINKIKKDIINTNEDFVSNMNTYSPNKLLESYLYILSKYDYIYETIVFLQSVSTDENIRKSSIIQVFSSLIPSINNCIESIYKFF